MTDLSIIIPGRNETFMKQTVENVLANIRGDTEIICVADGSWPNPPVKDNPRVQMIHFTESVGQRAATNAGARLSKAKFIMKLDAHCAVDEGFDIKLALPYQNGTFDATITTVPRLYNLHAFDWVCSKCSDRKYQGPTPVKCEKCGGTDFKKDMIWKPRLNRRSDFMRFDSNLHFQYWREYESRPEAKGDMCDLMSFLGACWFMTRRRYLKLEGLDEKHGSWGNVGTEVACKSWLSGGRLVVNKTTWYSHLFRTQGGDFGFPYPITGKEQEAARKYSNDLWKNGKWKRQEKPLRWLVEKFWPVPGWTEEDLNKLRN